MTDLLAYLDAELQVEEGTLRFLYDDATGKRFVQGMTLKGNLTIATGVNLMVGMDEEEVRWISQHRMQKLIIALQAYSWFAGLDIVRQVACADIAFNIGVMGLLHWPNFLAYLGRKDYNNAMKEIRDNALWVSQVKQERAERLEGMILTGQWPSDIHAKATP